MKRIDLKLIQPYFSQVKHRFKPFEVRKNDRDYEVGDTLVLHEWIPEEEKYAGDWFEREVIYVFDNPDYVKEGFVILGIE